jgi:hypothetical protein
MFLTEQFLKKQIVSVKYWLLGRESCIENLSDSTLSDWLPGVAYTGESTKNANNFMNLKKKLNRSSIPLTGLEDVYVKNRVKNLLILSL